MDPEFAAQARGDRYSHAETYSVDLQGSGVPGQANAAVPGKLNRSLITGNVRSVALAKPALFPIKKPNCNLPETSKMTLFQ